MIAISRSRAQQIEAMVVLIATKNAPPGASDKQVLNYSFLKMIQLEIYNLLCEMKKSITSYEFAKIIENGSVIRIHNLSMGCPDELRPGIDYENGIPEIRAKLHSRNSRRSISRHWLENCSFPLRFSSCLFYEVSFLHPHRKVDNKFSNQ